jgi:hypothetical protein
MDCLNECQIRLYLIYPEEVPGYNDPELIYFYDEFIHNIPFKLKNWVNFIQINIVGGKNDNKNIS